MSRRMGKIIFIIGAITGISLFAVAFSLLWLRSEIASDAKEIATLEYRLLEAQDTLRALVVNVDDSVQPHVLRSRVEGSLRTPSEGQVVRIDRSRIKAFDADQEAIEYRERDNSKQGGV